MTDTGSLHTLCWGGTYSYGKSLNVLILAVLDDLLQSVVVMWFSIGHYDHDLFNAPPGTPSFSESLFPEGNTDQREADQTQPRVGQHKKPYKNRSTLPSLDFPLRWPWTQLSEANDTVTPLAMVPQNHMWWGPTRHICLYEAQVHTFFGCCIIGMLWLMTVWERILVSMVRKWSLDGGDRRKRNKVFLFFAYLQ